MKNFLGYTMFGFGLMSVIDKLTRNTSWWRGFLIYILILAGLVLIIESTKEEIIKKFNENRC